MMRLIIYFLLTVTQVAVGYLYSGYGGNWLVSTTVNLTRRLDNGRINSSPVSRSPALVRWSEGCPSQSLRIPIEDADGGVVKCRYAKNSESYFQSDSFPYGTFDEVIDHFCVWNVKILEHKITHKAF